MVIGYDINGKELQEGDIVLKQWAFDVTLPSGFENIYEFHRLTYNIEHSKYTLGDYHNTWNHEVIKWEGSKDLVVFDRYVNEKGQPTPPSESEKRFADQMAKASLGIENNNEILEYTKRSRELMHRGWQTI